MKPALTRLIDRLTDVDTGILKFKAASDAAKEQKGLPPPPPPVALANAAQEESVASPTPIGNPLDHPLLPGTISVDEVTRTKMPAPKEALEAAVAGDRMLSLAIFWNAAFHTEKIYRLIFGTQIMALVVANGLPEISDESLKKLYEVSKKAGNEQTFDQWIGFLTGQQLLTRTPNGGAEITLAGRTLVKYIAIEGYPQYKLY